MENKKLIHAIIWSAMYRVIYGLLTSVGSLLFPGKFLMFCGIIGGIYIVVHAFCMKYRRNWLFISGDDMKNPLPEHRVMLWKRIFHALDYK